jgi:hypothetical protein
MPSANDENSRTEAESFDATQGAHTDQTFVLTNEIHFQNLFWGARTDILPTAERKASSIRSTNSSTRSPTSRHHLTSIPDVQLSNEASFGSH